LLYAEMLHNELVRLMENKIVDVVGRDAGASQGFIDQGRHPLDSEVENERAIHAHTMFARVRDETVSKSSGFDDHVVVSAAIGMEGEMPIAS
jgi:hypothetical protein